MRTILTAGLDADLERQLRAARFTLQPIAFTPFDAAAAAKVRHFETYNRTAAAQRVADIVSALRAHPAAAIVPRRCRLAALLAAAIVTPRPRSSTPGTSTLGDGAFVERLYCRPASGGRSGHSRGRRGKSGRDSRRRRTLCAAGAQVSGSGGRPGDREGAAQPEIAGWLLDPAKSAGHRTTRRVLKPLRRRNRLCTSAGRGRLSHTSCHPPANAISTVSLANQCPLSNSRRRRPAMRSALRLSPRIGGAVRGRRAVCGAGRRSWPARAGRRGSAPLDALGAWTRRSSWCPARWRCSSTS